MLNKHESGSGIGSWVPQLFYDVIARLVPGAIIIGTLAVAAAGPERTKSFVEAWMNKPASNYPSLIIMVSVGFVLAYALAIIFLGLCWPIEGPVFRIKFEKDFALRYDFIKQKDPPAGSRITKLKAEMHMTELLALGFSIALIINLVKAGFAVINSRGLFALVLLVAIAGSIGALRHFLDRQNCAVKNYSNLLGYEEWKRSQASLESADK